MTAKAAVKALTIKDLTPDTLNANKGTQRGLAMLESSVRRYGMGRSIVVDKHGRVIAGNKTLETAVDVGIDDLVVVPTNGKQLIVHQRLDLDLETDVAAKELGIADNRGGETGLAWDVDNLQTLESQGVDLQQFFREKEWQALLEAPSAEDFVEDTIPEMAIQPFEHHDYIMVVFRDSHAWTKACDRLGIQRESVTLGGRRKIGIGRVIAGERLLQILDEAKSEKKAKAKP